MLNNKTTNPGRQISTSVTARFSPASKTDKLNLFRKRDTTVGHIGHSKRNKPLSMFGLVMINVIAIDSLRNLPTNAAMALPMVFYYLIAGLIFLLPCLLVTAELATNRPHTGGAYIWVRDAFGARLGFLAIWLQWIYNVIWYPTILSFLAVNLAYILHPAWASSPTYHLSMIIGLFSLATLINSRGIHVSSTLSTLGAIIGTLLPMGLIIVLAAVWLWQGHAPVIPLHWHALIPQHATHILPFVVVILFSLMGFEMSSVHAGDVADPQRDYPRALLLSASLVVLTLVLSSLAIAIVVPTHQLNIIGGLDQAFSFFLASVHLSVWLPWIVLLIVVGAFCGMSAWALGPAKGLMVAAQDQCAPAYFGKANRYQAPIGMLIAQWIVVALLCASFYLIHSLNTWYWLLTDLAAQLALLFYILLFAAAIKLRYQTPHQTDAFYIPGGRLGVWVTGGIGILSCGAGMLLGFFPPTTTLVAPIAHYAWIIGGGCVLACLVPILLFLHSTQQ